MTEVSKEISGELFVTVCKLVSFPYFDFSFCRFGEIEGCMKSVF